MAPVAPAMLEHVWVPGIAVRPLAPPLLAPVEVVWHEPAHPELQHVVSLLSDTEMQIGEHTRRPALARMATDPHPGGELDGFRCTR